MTSSSACNPVRVIDTLDPTVLEERAQLIVKAAANLTPERWQDERELAKTKWFDYRFLSPIEATLKFVEDYQRAYRVQWRQSFDTATADKKRAIASGGLWHDRKEFTEFWNARAHADWLGVDYFIYCMVSMETALRRARQKRILRPGQMRSKDCVQAVQKRQEEEMSGRVWLSELPHYREENFCALPDQIAHQRHVAQTVRRRSNAIFALGGAIDALRVLPVHIAVEIFGEEHVTMARERASFVTVAPVELVPDAQLVPACFGLPAPLDMNAEPCCQCPLTSQCGKASESTLADVVALHGSADPRRAHVRELGRERVRRLRERRRLAGAGGVEDREDLHEAA
ncbi:hypothetical protein ACQVP2_02340 [Methylobacterium aquaticum]|uniref:hypothetical protein n=1 Tax=Methylobacterium aquaticum TaxID=270351 RepID=UPI003D16AD30